MPLAFAILLSLLAAGSAWAQAACDPAGPCPEGPGSPVRVDGWPAPAAEAENPTPDGGEAAGRSLDCARLSASERLAEREQALAACGDVPGAGLLPPLPDPAPPPPSPSVITTCDPNGCWDNAGIRYNGSGNTLLRQDGRVCRQIGNMVHCD